MVAGTGRIDDAGVEDQGKTAVDDPYGFGNGYCVGEDADILQRTEAFEQVIASSKAEQLNKSAGLVEKTITKHGFYIFPKSAFVDPLHAFKVAFGAMEAQNKQGQIADGEGVDIAFNGKFTAPMIESGNQKDVEQGLDKQQEIVAGDALFYQIDRKVVGCQCGKKGGETEPQAVFQTEKLPLMHNKENKAAGHKGPAVGYKEIVQGRFFGHQISERNDAKNACNGGA